MTNKIIFFDINGTLVKRDKRTDIPYAEAIDRCLNIKDGMEGVDTSARSDKDVFMEILEKNNLEFTSSIWNKFLNIYKSYLEKFKDTDVWRENANAVDFVKKMSKTDYKLALISGELSLGAKYKLKKLGIWDYFAVGGFGEDGLKRFDLADAALKKAENKFNCKFDIKYVIGDTILDIKTARHLSAKIISITTGSNTRKELLKENPDFIIDKFDFEKSIFEGEKE